MTEEIVWEDPPPAWRGIWVTRLAPLVDRPNVWARVYTSPSKNSSLATASNLRKRTVLMPPGRWEVAYRRRDEGGAVYARYLGPDEVGPT